jgi:hypothetical protein
MTRRTVSVSCTRVLRPTLLADRPANVPSRDRQPGRGRQRNRTTGVRPVADRRSPGCRTPNVAKEAVKGINGAIVPLRRLVLNVASTRMRRGVFNVWP